MNDPKIMVLGIGCLLFTDEGCGIQIIQELNQRYDFPQNVELVDGGLLGVSMTGYLTEPDHLIVIDAIRNNGKPGDIYRLENREIVERLKKKNSVQQVEFLEALLHCQAIDKQPKTVLIGVEPEDYKSLGTDLSPILCSKIDTIIQMVLDELKKIGISYTRKGNSENVSCDPFKSNKN